MRRWISDEPAQTEFLQIRLFAEQKRAVQEAAKQRGLTISEFARRALANASDGDNPLNRAAA